MYVDDIAQQANSVVDYLLRNPAHDLIAQISFYGAFSIACDLATSSCVKQSQPQGKSPGNEVEVDGQK